MGVFQHQCRPNVKGIKFKWGKYLLTLSDMERFNDVTAFPSQWHLHLRDARNCALVWKGQDSGIGITCRIQVSRTTFSDHYNFHLHCSYTIDVRHVNQSGDTPPTPLPRRRHERWFTGLWLTQHERATVGLCCRSLLPRDQDTKKIAIKAETHYGAECDLQSRVRLPADAFHFDPR